MKQKTARVQKVWDYAWQIQCTKNYSPEINKYDKKHDDDNL